MITGDHEKGCKYFRGEKCDCALTNKLRQLKVVSDCRCKMEDRLPDEEQREWLKRSMCHFHWMSTDYYRAKIQNAGMVKLANTEDLKSSDESLEGSIPSPGTRLIKNGE